MHKYAIILAGGRGSRLPIAGDTPKQFAPKFNGVTFVQDIEDMIAKAGFKHSHIIVVVTNEKQKKLAEAQLGPLGIPSTNIIQFDPHYGYVAVQAKAMAYIYKHDPEAVCFLSPSDQSISGQEEFGRAISIAYQYALEGIPIQIGVKCPDANIVGGCGNARYDTAQEGPVFDILEFIEKPLKLGGEELVKKILMDDNTVVNTGFYMVKASQFIAAYPEGEMDKLLTEWYQNQTGDDIGLNPTKMVTTLGMKLVVGCFNWQDCGTLEAYYNIQKLTPNHKNASIGDVDRWECARSLFVSSVDRVHIYSAYIHDCAVIASVGEEGDVRVAITNLKMSQEVGKITDFFESSGKAMSYSAKSHNNVIVPSNYSKKVKAAFLGVQNIYVQVNKLSNDEINVNVSANGDCIYHEEDAEE